MKSLTAKTLGSSAVFLLITAIFGWFANVWQVVGMFMADAPSRRPANW